MKLWELGPFTLVPHQRLLLRGQERIALGSRSFDLLLRLVESAGEVVGKHDLMAAAWPDTLVDDGNLRVHMAALRKALGSTASVHYITNVPLRGYSYVGPVREGSSVESASRSTDERPRVPGTLKPIFGRHDALATVGALLAAHRLVTITGPGGIGKTTTALAAARGFSETMRDGALLVELASVSDQNLVPSALAAVLGVEVGSSRPTDTLVRRLQDAELLLILDNCEHLTGAVAEVVEPILRDAPGVKILVTSREALRAEGERVYRLAPLRLPTRAMSVAEAARSPVVELLLDRVSALGESFAVGEGEVPALVALCERLDGIPLAFELAARLVPLFGLRGLATQLDDRFAVLTHGARTAQARHSSLRAAFDWSYELLSEGEQTMFRRLGVFRGAAPAGALAAVSSGSIDTLLALVDKSLVDVVQGDEPRFRLLESARAYALERLRASAEEDASRRAHASYLVTLLAGDADPAARGAWLDDARAAIEWAFSPGGDPALGVRLTVSATVLFHRSSLLAESRKRARTALGLIDAAHLSEREAATMRLRLHLTIAQSPAGSDDETLWHAEQALALATELGSTEEEGTALWGMWFAKFRLARHTEGLGHADAVITAATRRGDATLAASAQRIAAISAHLLGRQDEASARIHHFLALPLEVQRAAKSFPYNARVGTLAFRARIAWLRGSIELALTTLSEALAEAHHRQHAASLLFALMFGSCPIALGLRDVAGARSALAEMRRLTDPRHGSSPWSRCYEAMLFVLEGEHRRGITAIDEILERRELRHVTMRPYLSAFSAEAHLALGAPDAALRALRTARADAHANEEGWILPELARIEGETMLERDPSASSVAFDLFETGLALAREQGARFWELRLVTSAARAHVERDDLGRAHALLAPVVPLFATEPAVADVALARAALAEVERRMS